MDFYEKSKKLMYHHVDVITNIEKKHGFQSKFSLDNLEPRRYDVSVIGSRQLIYSGYMKTIDPLSKSVVLCNVNEQSREIEENIIILGHTICDLRDSIYNKSDVLNPGLLQEIIESDSLSKLAKHPYFHRPETEHTLTEGELKQLQIDILSWLKRYRIPVELNEDTQEMIVADCVRIKPPYNHESDYICPTRIVLQRIKHIVDSRLTSDDDLT